MSANVFEPSDYETAVVEVDRMLRAIPACPFRIKLEFVSQLLSYGATLTERLRNCQTELGVALLMKEQAERHHSGAMEAFKRAGVDYGAEVPAGSSIGVVWIDALRVRAETAEAQLDREKANHA